MISKKGISLIVLIVTIAVIIILTTVVIVTVSNNRPIKSAKDAKYMHNRAVLVENANVLSSEWKLEKRLHNDVGEVSKYIKDRLKEQGFTEEEIDDSIIIDDYSGDILELDENTIVARKVSENPNEYYGAYVTNYKENSGSGVGWRIFYSDERNIYLIADDYIPYDAIPYTTKDGIKTTNKPDRGSTSAGIRISSVISDYKGSESITDTRLQNLNSEYFTALNEKGIQSTDSKMKIVAYLLDIQAWQEYATNKAEYAIGAPTSELFLKSYNEKYPNSQEGYSDSLYLIAEENKATGMWLASPDSSSDPRYIIKVDHREHFHREDPGQTPSIGLRPVVCLKNIVRLEKQGENEYLIK